jgi:small subunit ribosomal protein S16
MGRRNRPFYRLCAFDARRARDSRSLEDLGHYDPLAPKNRKYAINAGRVQYWLSKGARPSERVAQILKGAGIAKG